MRFLHVGLLALTSVCGSAAAAPSDWEFVPVPSGADFLRDVGIRAPDDVWAVGSQDAPIPHQTKPYVVRWDGASWTEVPTPTPGVRRSRLEAVGFVSQDEVWVAGSQELQTGFAGSVRVNLLVMRWDGAAWEVMDTPKLGVNGAGALVRAIEVVGPDDIWFGGDWAGKALAMHWDGADFTIHPTPVFGPGGSGTFGNGHATVAMSALAPDDIWAVGGAADGDPSAASNIFHWDGATWQHVPGPTPGDDHRLFGVTAIAPDDVWAVGKSTPGGPFALHWDGASWSLDTLPAFVHPTGQLDDVVAFAADDVWACGTFLLNPAPDVARPLLMHYDGTLWTQVPSDPSGPALGWFRGLDTLPDGTAWVVGATGPGDPHAQRRLPGPFCPEPLAYGAGKTTSVGTTPGLAWTGTPSLASADLELLVTDAVPGKAGLAYWGALPANLPFQGGALYVSPPLKRMAVRVLDSGGAASYAIAIQPAMVGTTRFYQFWFRDPAHPDGTGIGLTSGLQIGFCP